MIKEILEELALTRGQRTAYRIVELILKGILPIGKKIKLFKR